MIAVSTDPLLQMLLALVKEARTLRDEFAVLDLPRTEAMFFAGELIEIEQKAADCIALCFGGCYDH